MNSSWHTPTDQPVPSVSAAQMRTVDEQMLHTYQITLLQMMENAGRNLADWAQQWLAKPEFASADNPSVAVLVGPGGNGGGGLVAARHLHNRGYAVEVVSAAPRERFAPVPAHQATIVEAVGIPLHTEPDLPAGSLLLDCLLGYSLRGDPRGAVAHLIEQANATAVPRLSLDTPSGLDVTTGEPRLPCMQATATLTLALPKTGFAAPSAGHVLGELALADISVPPALYQALDLPVPPNLFRDDRIVPLTPVDTSAASA